MDILAPTDNEKTTAERLDEAIRQAAPGTALRHALDMIIAAHLGALICIGDVENVIAAGDDGFKLDISFTANRLFELAKMDGAIVIDKDLTRILRANYHLNPDPSLPTSETGMRHRTAARMSLLTKALVISVSQRRQVVTFFIDGHGTQMRTVPELMGMVNQLLVSMQNTRTRLDHGLLRLTTLELDDYVTIRDVTDVLCLFEVLMTESQELSGVISELGSEGRTIAMQRDEFVGDMDETYTLMIRDYAADSTEENARAIRRAFHEMRNGEMRSAKTVAAALGFEDRSEDSPVTSLGLRTLSNVSVVRDGVADKLVNEYGSLRRLIDAIAAHPEHVGDLGVRNPNILLDTLQRMQGNRV